MYCKLIPAFVFCIIFLVNCKGSAVKLFTQLDRNETGISFKNTVIEDKDMNVLNYACFYNGGGVAVGDINNDGLIDLLFTGNMVKNRLYINKGNFNFEDVTDNSGLANAQGWCTGATMLDINGDGKIDIYICHSAAADPNKRTNLLYINNGDLSFNEKAKEYGLSDSGYSTQAAFFDYDKDGDLDMFVINHSLQQYIGAALENPCLRNKKDPGFGCKLYRNDNNHFSNVSNEPGIISSVLTFGLGLAISDFNNDGWPDLYVSNDFNEADYLFINNRNGTFTERVKEEMDEVSLYSMGSDAADYNNDGLTDLVTLDMLPEDNKTQKMHNGAENFNKFQMLFSKGFYKQYSRNMLHKNNGDGTFSETGQLAGVSNTDWSWCALFSDFDNEGNKDLFVTNGYVKDCTDMDFIKYNVDLVAQQRNGKSVDNMKDRIDKMPSSQTPNYLFQNKGNNRFENKAVEWGLDKKTVSSGAVYADLDNDGDMDLVVNITNDYAGIF